MPCLKCVSFYWQVFPDSKVNGVNMGPIWDRQEPGGPHIGPMNFACWVASQDAGIHPSPKAKSKWCLHPICTFCRFMKYMILAIPYKKYYWLCILTLYAPRSKGDEHMFSKWSLNTIVNFMEWNLTDSGEILDTVLLTDCFNPVQIPWRLPSLLSKTILRKVWVIVYACRQIYACKSNGRIVRHEIQFYALIKFAYILVDV